MLEVLIDAAVADARWSTSVYGQRLGIEDAKLLVKLLRYLARKLDQVAAVQFAVSPVEPE